LALTIRVPSGRITRILNEKGGITGETAIRLSRYFGNSARFWLNLQSRCGLAFAERDFGARIDSEIGMSAQV
jgi:antitoxin HigA-1